MAETLGECPAGEFDPVESRRPGIRDETIPTPPPVDPNVAPRPKNGFRSGFRLAILLAVLALLIYVFAPQLSNAVPALAGPLAAFVDTVNSGRTALSDMMQNLATSLPEEG